MPTLLLLLASNVFMTIAWYWHLKGGMAKPILLVILISWGIALIEYCLAVPANRIGYASGWSAGQLKIAQEAIALVVFGAFMVLWLGEPHRDHSGRLRANQCAGEILKWIMHRAGGIAAIQHHKPDTAAVKDDAEFCRTNQIDIAVCIFEL